MDGVPSDGLSAQVTIICIASNEAYAQAPVLSVFQKHLCVRDVARTWARAHFLGHAMSNIRPGFVFC